MKLLAIDIGNTFTKFALFDDKKLIYRSAIQNQEFHFPSSTEFDAIAVSSVVPAITKSLVNHASNSGYSQPFLINRTINLNYQLNYNSTETLGIDRICGTAGLVDFSEKTELSEYQTIMYADLGTATTINIVDQNIFIGGMIAPGLNTMFDSLNKNTAQLPKITMDNYSTFIGKSTSASIASGVITSTTGLLEKTYNELYSGETDPPPILLTGGNAEIVIKHLKIKALHTPNLVLNGIKKLYEINNE